MWVPTQEMRYSATSACFQAGPSLRFAGGKRYLMNQSCGQSKVWVGSGGQKCCITSASPERTAQRQRFPRPNSRIKCGAILYICRRVKLGVWGCVREMVCTVRALHSVFPTFLSTTTPFFALRAPSEPEKIKLSKGVLRSGNGGVAAKSCLEDPIWPPLPKEGVSQWWGQLEGNLEKKKT